MTHRVFDPLPWAAAALATYLGLCAALTGYDAWADGQARRCGCEGCTDGWCGR